MSIKKQRARVALFAYAYEMRNDSLVGDAEYDRLSLEVLDNINIVTDNAVLDDFFVKNFSADTGMWVLKHPDIKRLEVIYEGIRRHRDSSSPLH